MDSVKDYLRDIVCHYGPPCPFRTGYWSESGSGRPTGQEEQLLESLLENLKSAQDALRRQEDKWNLSISILVTSGRRCAAAARPPIKC